jgi:hypothetical protein
VDREDAQRIEPSDQPEGRIDLVRVNLAGRHGPIQPASALGRLQREQLIESLLPPLFTV